MPGPVKKIVVTETHRPVTSACPDSRETTRHRYWRPEIVRAIADANARAAEVRPARVRVITTLAYAVIFTITASTILRRALP